MSLTLVIQSYYQNMCMCGLSSLFCDNQPDNQCSENNIMWGIQQVMNPKILQCGYETFFFSF